MKKVEHETLEAICTKGTNEEKTLQEQFIMIY